MTEAHISRRADRLRSIQRARGRDRIANIFSATAAETPSFDDVELWTLIDGAPVDGKPNSEKTHVARAKREYDVAVDALSKGLAPLIAGVPVISSEANTDAFLDACDVATRVPMTGAPVHSVINALNLTLIASGELPVSVPRVAANALRESIRLANGGSTDALSQTLRTLRERTALRRSGNEN